MLNAVLVKKLWLVKVGPLSLTIRSGNPNCAKIPRRHWTVADAVIEDITCASIHFEM